MAHAMRHLSVCSILVLALGSTSSATTVSSVNSNLYREFPNAKLLSATATLTGPNQATVIYTTPSNADFVLTQLCASRVTGNVRLNAGGLGIVAQAGNPPCQTFTPGFVLPRTSTLSCATAESAPSNGSYFCAISGVQSPDVP